MSDNVEKRFETDIYIHPNVLIIISLSKVEINLHSKLCHYTVESVDNVATNNHNYYETQMVDTPKYNSELLTLKLVVRKITTVINRVKMYLDRIHSVEKVSSKKLITIQPVQFCFSQNVQVRCHILNNLVLGLILIRSTKPHNVFKINFKIFLLPSCIFAKNSSSFTFPDLKHALIYNLPEVCYVRCRSHLFRYAHSAFSQSNTLRLVSPLCACLR